MKFGRYFLAVFVLAFAIFNSACYEQANRGEVVVRVVRGRVDKVLRPEDGWNSTVTYIGDEYPRVSLTSYVRPIELHVMTKDNAKVKIPVNLQAHLFSDDASIKAHLDKWGLNEEERGTKYFRAIETLISAQGRDAAIKHDAYSLLANQEQIQKDIENGVREEFKTTLHTELEWVKVSSAPQFEDDRITQAAAQTVANQQLKRAAEASLAAAQVDNERKKLEAAVFQNPAMLDLKKLELQLEITRAMADGIAKHQGPLVLGSGNQQLQVPLVK